MAGSGTGGDTKQGRDAVRLEMQIELVEDCWTSLPGSRAIPSSRRNEERGFGIGTLQILQGRCRSRFLQKSVFFPGRKKLVEEEEVVKSGE